MKPEHKAEFKREERYLVLKISDLKGMVIPEEKINALDQICNAVQLHRLRHGKKQFIKCVVVESDWPEYETVWKMIQDRMEGKPDQHHALLEQVETLRKEHKLLLDIMTAHSKKQEAQLSALQAQIKAGELVPADVAVQWALEIPFGGMTLQAYVKHFTAEKQLALCAMLNVSESKIMKETNG